VKPRRRSRRQAGGRRGTRAGGAAERLSPEPPLGELPPRDAFLLNPYADVRYTQCPRCGHRTWRRKVPLLVVVAGYGPLVLGKTGPYCANCRLVIAHRDELEGELTTIFTRLAPESVGGAYAVLGTVELRAWRHGLSAATTIEDVLRHTAPFTATLTVEYRPATWAPAHPTAKPEPE
jgi:hypothetical protein